MPVCITCQKMALNKGTSPEHILLNGLGGKKKTKIATCTACNNKFGGTIDKALLDQVVFIRNLLNMKSGEGKPAPTRRNAKAGGKKIVIHGDGTIALNGKPFEISKNDDDSLNIRLNVSSEEEIAQVLPNISAATGIPQDRLIDAFLAGDGKVIHTRPDTALEQLQFGGETPNRSMVKSAFALWATAVSFDEPQKQIYDEARRFINEGEESFSKSNIFMDTRSLVNEAEIISRFGPCFNLIYVESNDNGKVVGRFTLYNILSWNFILAHHGGARNRKIGIISNPLITSDWTDKAANLYEIPFGWMDAGEVNVDFDLMKQRLDRIMQFYVGRGRKQEIGRIIEDVCSTYLQEGDPITPTVISEISKRVAHYALSLPYETPLNKNRLRDALKRSTR